MKIYPAFLAGALWGVLLLNAELPALWHAVIGTISLLIVGAISIRYDDK